MLHQSSQLVWVEEIHHFTRRGPEAWRIMALIFVHPLLIPLNGFLACLYVPGPSVGGNNQATCGPQGP